MKILILSDSHGSVSNMERAVESVRPDAIYHLGDCWRDAEKLRRAFPDIPLEQVPGNCDYQPLEPAEKLLFPGGKRVFLCHGHTRRVKTSLMEAGFLAEEQQLDVFLFGHTHRPLCDWRGKTMFLNPGSIGDYAHPTYAVLTIDGDAVNSRILELDA